MIVILMIEDYLLTVNMASVLKFAFHGFDVFVQFQKLFARGYPQLAVKIAAVIFYGGFLDVQT